MRLTLGMCALIALAACGADGEPERPAKDEDRGLFGLGVSATATVGMTGGNRAR